ncbi:hypothetical protein ACOME3_003886 [Neoechinorhynchus agilis]
MAVASIELIIRSIDRIAQYIRGTGTDIVMDMFTIILMAFTIASKLILVIFGRKSTSPATKAVVLDNRNDVFSNSAALTFGLIGAYAWKFIDPIGAILAAVYIFYTWAKRGLETTKSLVGRTADPYFLQKISFICLYHSSDIKYLETVRAFHIGTNYLVEVDIVLEESMELKTAHDIGESLQQKLELLPDTERADSVREAQFGSPDNYKIIWSQRRGYARLAIEADCPLLILFTSNCREVARSPCGLRTSRLLRWIYEKTRLPVIPLFGLFPVKLISHILDPIYPKEYDHDELKLDAAVRTKLRWMVSRHQKRIPGSILGSIIDRMYFY